MFFDTGKETVSSWKSTDEDGDPAVFLYRPRCLESFQHEMSFGKLATQRQRGVHHTAMMRDAMDITLEPNWRSFAPGA